MNQHVLCSPQVGKQLSDLTTRRVIFLVLFMVITLPLLNQNTYFSPPLQEEQGIYALHELAALAPYSETFNDTLKDYTRSDLNLLYIQLYGIPQTVLNGMVNVGFNVTDITNLDTFRDSELIVGIASACYNTSTGMMDSNPDVYCDSFAYFDNRASQQLDALLSICQTLFVIVLLAVGSVMFTTDSEKLVIQPIERMVKTVMMLADDPLGNMQEAAPDSACTLL